MRLKRKIKCDFDTTEELMGSIEKYVNQCVAAYIESLFLRIEYDKAGFYFKEDCTEREGICGFQIIDELKYNEEAFKDITEMRIAWIRDLKRCIKFIESCNKT